MRLLHGCPNSLKLTKGVVKTRSMPYHLLANASRAALHPLERRLLDGWSFPPSLDQHDDHGSLQPALQDVPVCEHRVA